ncbi:MAG: hypothetical protein WDN06_16635 [Asticcacaulis sp.]
MVKRWNAPCSLCRRRIEKRIEAAHLADFYLCSFSAKTLIYKGMFRAELVDDFYLDLQDPRFTSSVAIFHQRFSTNTFRNGGWPNPSACWPTTARSTPCAAMSTG